MSSLLESTTLLIEEARSTQTPVDILRPAVASMEREQVEALAVAYLLQQVHRIKAPAFKPTPKQKPIQRTPEMIENSKRIEERRIREYADSRETFKASIDKAFAILKYEWHVEWTEELLAAKIPLPDGSTIEFGDATREQHIERARIHRRNTMLNMESAARHEKAVEAMNESGARTLRGAVQP